MKIFLLLLMALMFGPLVRAEEDPGTFVCGEYEVRGSLHRDEEGRITLVLLPGTRGQTSVPLFDVPLKERIRLLNQYIQAKVRVIDAGSASEAAMELIGKPERTTEENAVTQPQRLIKEMPCP